MLCKRRPRWSSEKDGTLLELSSSATARYADPRTNQPSTPSNNTLRSLTNQPSPIATTRHRHPCTCNITPLHTERRQDPHQIRVWQRAVVAADTALSAHAASFVSDALRRRCVLGGPPASAQTTYVGMGHELCCRLHRHRRSCPASPARASTEGLQGAAHRHRDADLCQQPGPVPGLRSDAAIRVRAAALVHLSASTPGGPRSDVSLRRGRCCALLSTARSRFAAFL